MADIRINALPTTATDFASDDYIAIDGTTNGTRKLNAKTANLTFSDVTLGTSGPSVKSTLSARAPRQGLSYSGIAGANVTASVAAYGTAAFTNAVTFSVDSLSAQQTVLDSNNGILVFITTAGSLQVYNRVGAAYLYQSASGLIVAGQINQFVYSRGSVYLNGVLLQGSISDTSNYTGTTVYFGGDYAGGTPLLGKIYGPPLIYNRALSASEVVALYEAGAPAGADYNSASNTNLSSATFLNNGYGTFTGASATAFTASDSTGFAKAAYMGSTFAVTKGQKFLVSFNATLTSGAVPFIFLTEFLVADQSAQTTISAGANAIIVTATASSSASRVMFQTNAATSYAISGFSITRLGLLLAPDAAQAGGGLVWYDTSGNAANITLPASGVSWNVPTSGYVTSGSSLNLSAGGTNQNITLTPSGTGDVRLIGGTNSTLRFFNGATQKGALFFSTTDGALEYNDTLATSVKIFTGAAANSFIVSANGNTMLGTSGVDGGQKLQVSGTAAVSSTLSVGGNTASQQLHLNVDVYGASKSGGMRIGNSGNNYYSDLLVTTDSSSNPFVKLSFATHQLFQYAYGGGGNSWTFYTNNTTALTLSGSDQSATFAGKLYSVSGTATTPAFSFTGDTGTGMYRSSAGIGALAASGSTAAFWASNVFAIYSGVPLRLGNAYTAGAPTATGYVTIQDSAGNTYKVLVGT